MNTVMNALSGYFFCLSRIFEALAEKFARCPDCGNNPYTSPPCKR